ncbi:hypothetical protein [Kutzneria kofuensis]|uniref:Uncharacterized protein n=1 Tax=Kutzneria kofuensis TaxID=103725 RepID=A0A7W9NKB5_9PSEU|nr:hypothetical protein [Kutzneria kofuensis]MBB5896452.1 hypothetical protein [Kutzneria kofuensis]
MDPITVALAVARLAGGKARTHRSGGRQPAPILSLTSPFDGNRDAALKSFSANQESFSANPALTSGALAGKHTPLTSQSRWPTLRRAVLTVGRPFRTSVADDAADVF